MRFARSVYVATKEWPSEERYGLTAQVRRAAVAVPSNIAEGQGRLGAKEFAHHLSIAHGSLCEAETQLLLAQSLDLLPAADAASLLEQAAEVGRLIRGLLRKVSPMPC